MNLILIHISDEIKESMWAESFIVSCKGAHFIIFPEKHHTKEDIKKAKWKLKLEHDVTGIEIGNYDEKQGEIWKNCMDNIAQFERNHNVKL